MWALREAWDIRKGYRFRKIGNFCQQPFYYR
jgi:hypothetical protein